MDPTPVLPSRLHAAARARAHELREQALDQAWGAAAAALSRAWRSLVRRRPLAAAGARGVRPAWHG